MRHLTISCLALCAVNLSGCAQITNFGDMIWSETKSLTLTSKDKLMAVLRPRSDRADPVFINSPAIAEYETVHADQSIEIDFIDGLEPLPAVPNTYLASTEQAKADTIYDLYSDMPVYESYNQTAEITQVPTYSAPPSYSASSYDTTSYNAAPYNMAAYDAAPNMSNELPDLSYVKLVGSPNAIDWQNCQAQAGGYILADEAGFRIRPDFDYCMRVNGYVPEREAVGSMEVQALP